MAGTATSLGSVALYERNKLKQPEPGVCGVSGQGAATVPGVQ